VAPEDAGRLADLGDGAWRVVLPGSVQVDAALAAAVGGIDDAAHDPGAASRVAYRLLQCGARLEAAAPAPPRWPWDGAVAAPDLEGDRHRRPSLAHDVPAQDLRVLTGRRWRVPAVAVVLETGGDPEADDLAAERLLLGSWSDMVLVAQGTGASSLVRRLDDPRLVDSVPAWTPVVVRASIDDVPDSDGLRCLLGRLDRDRLDAVRLLLGPQAVPGPVAVRVAAVARARVAAGAQADASAALAEAVTADPEGLVGRLPRSWVVAGTAVGWAAAPVPGDARWDPAAWPLGAPGEHDHALLLESDGRVAALEADVARLERERDAARAEAARWRAQLRAWRPRGVRDWGRTGKAYVRSLRRPAGGGGA
jgi:hypothetical protein